MEFYDTNILYGLATGDPRCRAYKDRPFRTSDANLSEFRFLLLRRGLTYDMEPFLGTSEPVAREDFLSAADLRVRHHLPAMDALCYAVARRLGTVFVTADRAHFKGLSGVELV